MHRQLAPPLLDPLLLPLPDPLLPLADPLPLPPLVEPLVLPLLVDPLALLPVLPPPLVPVGLPLLPVLPPLPLLPPVLPAAGPELFPPIPAPLLPVLALPSTPLLALPPLDSPAPALLAAGPPSEAKPPRPLSPRVPPPSVEASPGSKLTSGNWQEIAALAAQRTTTKPAPLDEPTFGRAIDMLPPSLHHEMTKKGVRVAKAQVEPPSRGNRRPKSYAQFAGKPRSHRGKPPRPAWQGTN